MLDNEAQTAFTQSARGRAPQTHEKLALFPVLVHNEQMLP